MKIKVKQWHIDNGLKSLCSACPIALAVRGYVRNDVLVRVLDYIQIEQIQLYISNKVVDWIDAFDKGEAVSPFEFNLDIPKEYLK